MLFPNVDEKSGACKKFFSSNYNAIYNIHGMYAIFHGLASRDARKNIREGVALVLEAG